MRALPALVLALSLWSCRPRPALTFGPHRLPDAQSGQPYRASITVLGNVTPVNWIGVAEGRLPAGLTLASERGDSIATVSGTSTEAGSFVFTVEAACLGTNRSGQTGRQVDTLVVK